MLLANNDFVIIDFEGEPARPLAERRRKHSPLRDVAGMVRSFNYAQTSALAHVAQAEGDAARLAPLAADWEADVRRVFLGPTTTPRAAAGVVRDRSRRRGGLLELFELEKALYELRYEIDNRPDWVRTPLAWLLALVAGSSAQPRLATDSTTTGGSHGEG